MSDNGQPVVILLADDDEDDQRLTKDALQRADINAELHTVENGEALLAYLRHEGDYSNLGQAPRPRIILLDLNMPIKDGREALIEIKADEKLRSLPVVVLTTSEAAQDVYETYNLGASSFITKPATFTELVQLMQLLSDYWIDTVRLPVASGSK